MYDTRRNACQPASPRPVLIATHGPAHRVAHYPTIPSRSRPVRRASSATGTSPSRMGRHENTARPISNPTRREAVAPSTLSRFGLAFLTPRRSAAAFCNNGGRRPQGASRFQSPRRRQQRLVRERCTTPAEMPASPHRLAPCRLLHMGPRTLWRATQRFHRDRDWSCARARPPETCPREWAATETPPARSRNQPGARRSPHPPFQGLASPS